jgi:starch synthase (maltosyl-transferring)
MSSPEEGRRRVVIEAVKPEIDGGLFPIKRTVGEKVIVEADIFADGHDSLSCILKYRREGNAEWIEVPMEFLVNDRWRGQFRVQDLGRYRYILEAWVDRFKSWRQDLAKKVEAGQDVSVELLAGVELIEEASRRATGTDVKKLQEWARALKIEQPQDRSHKTSRAVDEELAKLIDKYPDKRFASSYDRELEVVVDREKARVSAWYEMFPRSCTVSRE